MHTLASAHSSLASAHSSKCTPKFSTTSHPSNTPSFKDLPVQLKHHLQTALSNLACLIDVNDYLSLFTNTSCFFGVLLVPSLVMMLEEEILEKKKNQDSTSPK